MALGIQKTKETIEDLTKIAVAGVEIAKDGLGIGSFLKVVGLLNVVKELVVDAPLALPELADLDAAESAEIGAAAYNMVKSIILAIKK